MINLLQYPAILPSHPSNNIFPEYEHQIVLVLVNIVMVSNSTQQQNMKLTIGVVVTIENGGNICHLSDSI